MKEKWKHKIAFILGIFFIISPFVLYWIIHGNYERYLWIINQPYPLSHFGGAPYQLYIGIILIIIGISFLGISTHKKYIKIVAIVILLFFTFALGTFLISNKDSVPNIKIKGGNVMKNNEREILSYNYTTDGKYAYRVMN